MYVQSTLLAWALGTWAFTPFSGNFARDLSGAEPSWLYLPTHEIILNDASPTCTHTKGISLGFPFHLGFRRNPLLDAPMLWWLSISPNQKGSSFFEARCAGRETISYYTVLGSRDEPQATKPSSLATRGSWLFAVAGQAPRKAKPFNEHTLIGTNL